MAAQSRRDRAVGLAAPSVWLAGVAAEAGHRRGGAESARKRNRDGDRDLGRVRLAYGDAFIGAFARYYAAGLSLDAALDKATRYAANSVAKRGA